MKSIRIILLGVASVSATYGHDNASTTPLFESALTSRLFPELAAFWQQHGGQWPANVYPSIKTLQHERQDRLRQSVDCKPKPLCTIESMLLSANDTKILTTALQQSQAPQSLLEIWPTYVNATNRMLRVYGNGTAPMYPDIDAINYPANSSDYILFLTTLQTFSLAPTTPSKPPPWDAIDYALTLLDANDRDNALYFANLWQAQNAPALARSKSINWSSYPYAAILIPGAGPEIYDVPLSFLSKIRVRIAVSHFHRPETRAPFMIPSGGYVHPNQTSYSEAVEMGEWMETQYGIGKDVIALEPDARHTTTNLRNAARVLKKLGAPEGMKVLIVSDGMQRDNIASESFKQRCLRELGYVTGEVGRKVGDFGVEWVPNKRNLVVDPRDPLDP